jgi:minor extracellular protease Epr
LKFQTTGSVSLADARFKQKEDHTSLSLYEGESVSVLANGTLTPENRGVITWTSENTAVATVSKEGVVTAVGEGSTRILASYGTETLVCTVTVKKVPETKASAVEKNTSSGQQNTVSQTEKNTEKKETTTTTVTKPKKVTIKKVKAGKKKATVTWQKVTGASGYEVWMKTGSGAFKKVKSLSAKKTSLTVKKLKAGKKYTFKVRAYKKGADGKKVYGAYSKKKTIKI